MERITVEKGVKVDNCPNLKCPFKVALVALQTADTLNRAREFCEILGLEVNGLGIYKYLSRIEEETGEATTFIAGCTKSGKGIYEPYCGSILVTETTLGGYN